MRYVLFVNKPVCHWRSVRRAEGWGETLELENTATFFSRVAEVEAFPTWQLVLLLTCVK